MTRDDSSASSVLPDKAAALRAAVLGPVLVPGDDDYTAECAIYNLNLTLEPALVVGATRAEDVQAAVVFAAEHGRPVAVKTTGHQMVDPAHEAVLITTGRMNDIVIDADNRTARVGAGVIWQQVIDKAAPLGLAPLSGSAPGVGVVGYTLGGGQSPVLGRSLGYAADHVRSVDLVTADGELRHVTAESDPELFWGLRGGKGNFGVVTALEFSLFPLTRLYGGGIYFPGELTSQVLHAWRTWLAGIPEEMTSSIGVQRLPPLPELPEPLRGAFVLHLRIGYTGSAADGERLLAPLRAIAPPLLDTVAEMPYTAVGSIHLDPPMPMPYFDRTTMLREFPVEAVDKLVELVGPDSDSPLVNVEIRSLGGAFDREPAIPDAVPMRGLPFVIFGFGVGPLERSAQLRAALAEVVDGMEPWADSRKMPNFLSAEEGSSAEQVAAAYGPDRYKRLTDIKTTYDPSNMFRVNHNLRPV